jgi:glycyl-tRNA synthetase beta chain
MAEFLLEILSEEIPARMQARAADDLKRLVCDGLKGAGIGFEAARAYATPRRLALVVEGIPAVRDDVSEEKRGPRVGAPDQAVQGFLKGAGLASLDQAEKRDTGKGEFWFAVITKKGGPTAEALPQVIDAALKALPVAQVDEVGQRHDAMGTPAAGHRRAVRRPDAEAGEVSPGGADGAGREIRRHDARSSLPESRASFARHRLRRLRREASRPHTSMLDPAERKKIILDGARRLCRRGAGRAASDDEGLLDEVTGLVEWPVPHDRHHRLAVHGRAGGSSDRVDEDASAPLRDDEGGRQRSPNRFVVVANNVARDGGKTIVEGNERVLRARLSDAKFFWDQDRKT